MRNRIVSRLPAAELLQPPPALRSSVSSAFQVKEALADKTKMQSVTTAQHGQAARLPHQKEQAEMKMNTTALVALTLGLGAVTLLAQNHAGRPGGPPGAGGGFGPPPGGGPPPAGPIMIALDANADGTLDATEIANASTALKALDQNRDGKLSADELMPPPAGGTNQFRFTPPPDARRPVPPPMAALDANSDRELDATEIANASAALLKLDANGDGKLTQDELRPKGLGRSAGPGGPPGEGGASAPGDSGDTGQPATQ